MPKIELQPLAKTPEALPAFLSLNFRRIADEVNRRFESYYGSSTVTGTATITTDLTEVLGVVASLTGIPSAGACFVRARVSSSNSKDVVIDVYSNTFAVSAVGVGVAFLAVGR